MIGRCADNTGLTFIDFDFEEAVVVAVDHLVELEHRRIAFFNSGVLRLEGYGPAVRAFDGYERAVRQHGIETLHFEVETIAEAVSVLAESNITAVILGVHASLSVPEFVRAVWQQGYRVPQDLCNPMKSPKT